MATTITEGTIHVFTYKEGMLSRLAHDLRLSLKKWKLVVEGREVHGYFDPKSLEVDGVVKGQRIDTKILTPKDLSDIAENIEKHVLKTARHPEITYEGRLVAVKAGKLTIRGKLMLVGRAGPLELNLERVGDKLVGQATILQTRWGIVPFKAALGSIKIKNDVGVRVDLPAPELDAESL
jgi:polyisoprenoid-binding protein YceI